MFLVSTRNSYSDFNFYSVLNAFIGLVVMCNDPDIGANSAVIVTTKDFGGTANYTCNSGFAIASGDSIRYCSSSGVVVGYWTGSAPACIGKLLIILSIS